MPRQARIDSPGAIHHIICRGIERRKIFWDDIDRDSFLSRLGDVLQKTCTPCYAWALIPNHFHLLLQTGMVPIASVMRRLLTGYAVQFNRRHNRVGHLFYNRYKSILCQKEPYLLELVRYIHLNPIRAGIVGSMGELKDYRYCGHGRILAGDNEPWQEIDDVLIRFDEIQRRGRTKYEIFVAEGIAAGKRADLVGGGLVRSSGGWQEVIWARRSGTFLKNDERILGDSVFVEAVLSEAEEHLERECAYRMGNMDLEQVAQRVAEGLKIEIEKVWHSGKNPDVVQARSLLCYWATHEIGVTATALGLRLGITQSAVSRAALRGEQLAVARGLRLK